MSQPVKHLVRMSGFTACGWVVRETFLTVRHHERVTCRSCLKVINGNAPRAPSERAEARRGGTDTGLGKLKCVICRKPYSMHPEIRRCEG